MKRSTIIALAAALVTFGCAWLSIAGYDAAFDRGVADLQQKVEVFLSGLRECAGTPEAAHGRHIMFYGQTRQDIEALRELAAAKPGNERTVRSLQSLRENIEELEALHRAGISGLEVDLMAGLFATQFRMLRELENAKAGKEQH